MLAKKNDWSQINAAGLMDQAELELLLAFDQKSDKEQSDVLAQVSILLPSTASAARRGHVAVTPLQPPRKPDTGAPYFTHNTLARACDSPLILPPSCPHSFSCVQKGSAIGHLFYKLLCAIKDASVIQYLVTVIDELLISKRLVTAAVDCTSFSFSLFCHRYMSRG